MAISGHRNHSMLSVSFPRTSQLHLRSIIISHACVAVALISTIAFSTRPGHSDCNSHRLPHICCRCQSLKHSVTQTFSHAVMQSYSQSVSRSLYVHDVCSNVGAYLISSPHPDALCSRLRLGPHQHIAGMETICTYMAQIGGKLQVN